MTLYHGLNGAKQLTYPVILETDKKPWFITHAYLYLMIMNYEYLITNTTTGGRGVIFAFSMQNFVRYLLILSLSLQ